MELCGEAVGQPWVESRFQTGTCDKVPGVPKPGVQAHNPTLSLCAQRQKQTGRGLFATMHSLAANSCLHFTQNISKVFYFFTYPVSQLPVS